MAISNAKVIDWFVRHRGKLTYSMNGSRNGADGTADCSGSMTQAIYEAGGSKYAYLYSTVTLGGYLSANGYKRITTSHSWSARGGDVVLMSWGSSMASSGGAGGHVGVMMNATDFISTDWTTKGQRGTAVSTHKWSNYYSSKRPVYMEVWRLNGTPAPNQPSNGLAIDGWWGTATTKKLQQVLGCKYVDGVISGQIKQVGNEHVPSIQWGKGGSLVIKAIQRRLGLTADGYLGKKTVTAMQKHFGTPADGYISKGSLMVQAMQRALNKNKF